MYATLLTGGAEHLNGKLEKKEPSTPQAGKATSPESYLSQHKALIWGFFGDDCDVHVTFPIVNYCNSLATETAHIAELSYNLTTRRNGGTNLCCVDVSFEKERLKMKQL